MKSEPDVYSIDALKRDKRTLWTGVRNYQARNYMLGSDGIKHLVAEALKAKKKTVAGNGPTMEPGDLVLFYHSNAEPTGIAGIARIEKVGIADPEQFSKKNEYFEPKATKERPMWYCADVGFHQKFDTIISLEQIRSDKELQSMVLLQKGSRLSVQPVSKSEFQHVCDLAKHGVSRAGLKE